MDKILFRGKTQHDKWVYWNEYGELVGIGGKKRTTYEYRIARNGISYYCYVHALRDSKLLLKNTIGRFTGLTDRNGKKIFEGDILKAITVDTNTERFAVVGFGEFEDENCGDTYIGFYIEFDTCKTTITQLSLDEVKDRFEVIGNIHNNPELLEVKQ